MKAAQGSSATQGRRDPACQGIDGLRCGDCPAPAESAGRLDHGAAHSSCALGITSGRWRRRRACRAAADDRWHGRNCGQGSDLAVPRWRASRRSGTSRRSGQSGPLAQNPLGGKQQHYQAKHGKPVPQIALPRKDPHLGRKGAVCAQHFRERSQGGAAEISSS